jgi:hypothetical protein
LAKTVVERPWKRRMLSRNRAALNHLLLRSILAPEHNFLALLTKGISEQLLCWSCPGLFILLRMEGLADL